MCGHSLGAGVAGVLGLVRHTFLHFYKRMMIKATRRNGPTPRHASQHVPAAFPSGGASRYIVLPRRKFASPDAPPFGPYVRSPVPHGIRISANFPKILSPPSSTLTTSCRASPWVRCATCPAPQSGFAKQRPRAVQRDTAASPAGRSDTKWALDRATIPSGCVVFPKLLVKSAHPRRNSSSLSARRSRRTCPYTISTHLGAFCGPFATRTCRTLRRRPRSVATVRWRHCARIARRMASACSRCSTWRKCSRRSSSPATWSGTSHNAFVRDANGILTWDAARTWHTHTIRLSRSSSQGR